MKHLAVINTKTNEVKIYKGKSLISATTFSRALFADEVESYRVNPAAFLKSVGVIPTPWEK